jgi:prepilin-type processing-associated H-X9-DG protein
VDRVAVCPTYPKNLLRQQDSEFNPNSYSWNRHVDGDGSNLGTEHLAEQPSGGQAYLCIRSEGNATTPSELCVIMDSADTGDTYQPTFAWNDIPDSVEQEGSLPNRHNDGGNLLFADGHVEFKRNVWLRDREHARLWVSPSGEDSGAWTMP